MRANESRMGLPAIALACTLAIAAGPSRLAAQACPGDCNGDGQVTIDEIVVAVAVVLGLTPLSACAVLGPAPVGVNRVIASVNSAQCACRPCPTPPPTRTPTVTPRPATATPPPTPTRPERRESTWQEDNARLGNSTCRSEINQAIREQFTRVSCPLDVVRLGDRVEVVDCDGIFYAGTIDGAGLFTAQISQGESVGPCRIDLGITLRVNLRNSPSTANYDVMVDFSGSCAPFNDCRLAATTRWTLLSGTAAGRAAGADAPRGMVSQLLPELAP